MIRRIGEMLRFEAKRVALLIDVAVLAMHSVEKITGVELHSRFGGVHFQHSAGSRVISAAHKHESRAFAVNHEVVVIAPAELNLFILLANSRANLFRFSEIEWSSMHTGDFAGGNQC